MVGKIFQYIISAVPGVIKIVELFRKKRYPVGYVEERSEEELRALQDWKHSSTEDRKIIRGED